MNLRRTTIKTCAALGLIAIGYSAGVAGVASATEPGTSALVTHYDAAPGKPDSISAECLDASTVRIGAHPWDRSSRSFQVFDGWAVNGQGQPTGAMTVNVLTGAPQFWAKPAGPYLVRYAGKVYTVDGSLCAAAATTTTEAPTEPTTTTTEAPPTTTTEAPPTVTTSLTTPVPTTTTEAPLPNCATGDYVFVDFGTTPLPAQARLLVNGELVTVDSGLKVWISVQPLGAEALVESITEGVTVTCGPLDLNGPAVPHDEELISAGPQLPRTGSNTLWLGLTGAAFVAGGGGLVARYRTRG